MKPPRSRPEFVPHAGRSAGPRLDPSSRRQGRRRPADNVSVFASFPIGRNLHRAPSEAALLRLDGETRPRRPNRRKIDEIIKVAPGHRRHLPSSLLPVTDCLRVDPHKPGEERLARLQLYADRPYLRGAVVSGSQFKLASPNGVKARNGLASRGSFHKFVDPGAGLGDQRRQPAGAFCQRIRLRLADALLFALGSKQRHTGGLFPWGT